LEIAFATDLLRYYSKSELQPIVDLAKTFKSTIRIVNVAKDAKPLSDIQKFNLNSIQKYFGDIPNQLHSTNWVNSISRTLEVFSQELDVHLLALLNYPHSYLEKVNREPVVKKIAFHTRIPLLVIPEIGMTSSSKQRRKNVMARV
jgi:hypothetical protein